MAIHTSDLVAAFEETFLRKPRWLARAPGRVNLIGEHTDYNEGYVLPMALECNTAMVAALRRDRRYRIFSKRKGAWGAFTPALDMPPKKTWLRYLYGVAREFQRVQPDLPGLDVLLWSDVPMGSGLSSSAALEMVFLRLLEHVTKHELPAADAAALGQKVEHEYVGVPCGIMDQFASRAAQKDTALFLDCRTLEYRTIPIRFPDHAFVIADTGVPRFLRESAYTQRVAECRAAVQALSQYYQRAATALRDFTLDELQQAESALDSVSFRRARHVLTENQRVLGACGALANGEAARFAQLLIESHESLRNDYEVTGKFLDTMVHLALAHPACLGGRMTGAGFGGATLHVVEKKGVEAFTAYLGEAYRNETKLEPQIFTSAAADGAHAEDL
jgi:galactokinase